MNEFTWPIRVYYEDTDSGGVVYHSNYLNFMERARTEWLRSLGIEQDRIVDEFGVIFAVRSLSIDYLKPAVFNDALEVRSRIDKLGKASISFEQTIVRTGDELLLSRAGVKVACISAGEKRAVAIPEQLLKNLE